jgi:hypothetical protein
MLVLGLVPIAKSNQKLVSTLAAKAFGGPKQRIRWIAVQSTPRAAPVGCHCRLPLSAAIVGYDGRGGI